jgi:hypothetical protein
MIDKLKAKAVPLHAAKAIWGERSYSSYSFSTSAPGGGVWYIYKCRYEIKEQKEVPVWYTDIYRPISSTAYEPKYKWSVF